MPSPKPGRPRATKDVKCPVCGAEPGQPCRAIGEPGRLMSKPHSTRVRQ